MSSYSPKDFEEEVWSTVAEGELELLTKEEMADTLLFVALELGAEADGRERAA